MTLATFITRNALRNKRRAALSIVSVGVSLFLLITLLVALREMTVPPEDIGAALRVVVRNRVSIMNVLPARQRSVIERVPGVEAVSPFTYFAGKFRNEEFPTFAQFSMDPKLLRPIFGEAKMPDEQFEAFIKDQTSCIVGKLTADKYKLKIGDRMQFTSTMFGCAIELKIAGIYSGTLDDRNVLFHQKYLDETWDLPGRVGMWWVKVRSVEEMPGALEGINKAFASTSAEVRAETERAFQLAMVSTIGGVKVFINSVSTVVVFTLLLVSASTMSMAIRERFRELAVLKAMGFRRHELFALILAESFALAAAGSVTGIGGAWLFFTHARIAGMVAGAGAMLILMLAVKGSGEGRRLHLALFLFLALLLGVFAWSETTFVITQIRPGLRRLLVHGNGAAMAAWSGVVPLFVLAFIAAGTGRRAGLAVSLFFALVTAAAGWFAYTHGTISQMTNNIFLTFEVTPRIIAVGAAVAAALGVAASILPSVAVARMSVVEGLKTLD